MEFSEWYLILTFHLELIPTDSDHHMDMDIDEMGGGNTSDHAMDDVWSTLSHKPWELI
jgi:hypothetical protein